jgi:hypothetical protein
LTFKRNDNIAFIRNAIRLSYATWRTVILRGRHVVFVATLTIKFEIVGRQIGG